MTGSAEFELKIERVIDAPADMIFRAWVEADLLKQWFCPKPWKVIAAKLDPRAGGVNEITMQGPDGQEIPSFGIYLEVVPNQRIVVTDAYTFGWVPAAKPFMTGIVELDDLGSGKTKYTAIARHWNEEDMQAHKEMGFYEGWGKATDQLEDLLRSL